jgi:hypothetical protein
MQFVQLATPGVFGLQVEGRCVTPDSPEIAKAKEYLVNWR